MNGVDRVFVSALNTVKRLPTHPGAPKPPLEDRLLLYGLFKQSMEGDVPEFIAAQLDHPAPPASSARGSTRPSVTGSNSARQQLGGEDDEGGSGSGGGDDGSREKIGAWLAQKGTSRHEAKRLYITTLLRSMRQYGSQTATARALIDELDFVWQQVRASEGSGSDDDDGLSHADSGELGASPIRTRASSRDAVQRQQRRRRRRGPHDDEDDDEENDEGDEGEAELVRENGEDLDEEELGFAPPNVYRTAPHSPARRGLGGAEDDDLAGDLAALRDELTMSRMRQAADDVAGDGAPGDTDGKWRARVELALQHLRAELAGVRETMVDTSSPDHTRSRTSHNPLAAAAARLHPSHASPHHRNAGAGRGLSHAHAYSVTDALAATLSPVALGRGVGRGGVGGGDRGGGVGGGVGGWRSWRLSDLGRGRTYHLLLSAIVRRAFFLVRLTTAVLLYDLLFGLCIWYYLWLRDDPRASIIEFAAKGALKTLTTKLKLRVRKAPRAIADRR
ncbi:hypothetical protein PYCC9005_002553 [Savitreella phatthalungensis]